MGWGGWGWGAYLGYLEHCTVLAVTRYVAKSVFQDAEWGHPVCCSVCVCVACLGSVKLLRRPIRVAIAGLDLRRGGIQSNATDTCTRTILVQPFFARHVGASGSVLYGGLCVDVECSFLIVVSPKTCYFTIFAHHYLD